MKPRVLFVARGRLSLPLAPSLQKKWDALSDVFDVRVLNSGTGTDPNDSRIRLLPLNAPAFYAGLPFAVAAELRARRTDAIVASDPYVGLAARTGRTLARSSARLIVEVHGDPRTFTRLYGSSLRKLLSPVADAAAHAGIAGADATRSVSTFTGGLIEEVRGEPATATFLAYSDLSAFADTPPVPLPERQRIVFVGALELYKNIDGLAQAWRRVVTSFPEGVLSIVGEGSRRAVVDRLVADLPGRVEHRPRLDPADVARELDLARALVLPSWPEGLGRVVLEAFARGRAVIGTNGGGIPDIVTDDVDGILVPRADVDALSAAIQRILADRELSERLGSAARETYAAWHQTPEDFARNYQTLVARAIA